MKSIIAKSLIVALFAGTVSTSTFALRGQQRDTAIGAVIGGVAGAVIGNDVVSSVAGAALGGVVGSQWKSHKRDNERRYDDRPRRHHKGKYYKSKRLKAHKSYKKDPYREYARYDHRKGHRHHR